MGWDARFDAERSLGMDFMPKIVKKIGFLTTCRFSPKLFILLYKQKEQTALRDAYWIAWRSSRKFFSVRSVVYRRSGLRLSSPGKLPQVCVCYYTLASPRCPCDLGVPPKIFESNFRRIFILGINGFPRLSGKIFVSGFVVLYLTHNCQLSEPRCPETAFAKQRLATDDFWDEKTFFPSKLFVEVMIVTVKLRCYLMVVFCLISPYFATCSLALHKHLVSVLVKRLSTFASLTLSTLVPMSNVIVEPFWARQYFSHSI